MTSAFESAFINHLKEKKRGDPWFRRRHEHFGVKKVKENSNLLIAHRMVLKKYRKQWQSYRSVRKKTLIEHLKNAAVSTENKSKTEYRTLSERHSWPSFNTGVNADSLFPATRHSQSLIFSKRHTIDTSDLQSASFCTDFPISEIETELSGNRGNGNSPFNSSNSCGSPEGLNLDPHSVQNVKQSSDVKIMNQNNQKMCLTCSLDIEPNNNSELANICSCNKKNDLEADRINKETNISNSSEDYIDVVSVDNDDEPSEMKGASEKVEGESDDKSVQLYININERCDSPVMYVGSNSSRNALKPPPISPVKWQQQFMSFLTSASTVSNQDQLENDNMCNDLSVSSHSHFSSRRKRSRKVRSNTCPCCLGLSSHKRRQKHYSTDGKHSHHSKKLSREQRHFIRDMMQLVSLRNRIVQLLCVLLPECKDQLNDINPDTDSVEKCIDQIIFILKSGSPSFHDETQESYHRVVQNKISNSAAQENDLDSVFDASECPSLIKSPDISQSEFNSAYGEETDDEDMPVLDHFMSVDEQTSQHQMSTKLSENNQCNFRTSSTCREGVSRLQIISDADSGIVHDDDMTANSSLDFTRTSLKSENDNYSFERGKTVKSDACDDQNVCDSVIVTSASTETKLLTELGTDNGNESVTPCERDPSSLKTRKSVDMETDDKDVNSICVNSSASVVHEIKSLDDDNNNSDGICKLESENGQSEDPNGLFLSSENMNTEASCHPKNRSDPFINQEFAFNYSSKGEQRELSLNQPKDVDSDDSNSINRAVPCDKALLNSNHATADKYLCHDIAPEIENHTPVIAVVPSMIAVYDPQIVACKKPKICLKAFKRRVYRLLHWLLPELALESNFFKNTDNLEFLLDTIIVSNQKHLNADH